MIICTASSMRLIGNKITQLFDDQGCRVNDGVNDGVDRVERGVDRVERGVTNAERDMILAADLTEYLDQFNTANLAWAVLNQKTKVYLQKTRRTTVTKQPKFNAVVAGYKDIAISPRTILYGPPGNGKTNLARFIADNSALNFVPVGVSDLIHKQVGESERYIQSLFQTANSLIFFDEIDSMFTSANLVAQLVHEMDNAPPNIHVLAATNNIHAIDSRLLLPGRLDNHVFLDNPTFDDRLDLIALFLSNFKHQVNLEEIAHATHGLSCSEIKERVRRAILRHSDVLLTQDFY